VALTTSEGGMRREVRFARATVLFFIKPADGFELPEI
jgi:hypothetical protein